jgi:hypothetical protein
VFTQRLELVAYPVHHSGDRGQVHAQLAQEQDLLQAKELVPLVVPITVHADP